MSRCLLAVLLLSGGMIAAPVAAQTLRTVPYLTGLDQPVGLVADPSDPRRQFVVEKTGRLRLVLDGVLQSDAVLDLSTIVASAGEQGLLGLAVDPAFATTGRIWVNFTRVPDGATVIARFTRAPGEPFRFDPAARLDLAFSTSPEQRFIAQPATNHNGGKLLFDRAGYLLVAMGDGGGANDPSRTAQDPQRLLGKLLRLDVHVPDEAAAPAEMRADAARGYRIPPTNPFVDGIPVAARPEIWAFGVRNPWRVTMDDPALGGTGALLIADVGQGAREEIDYEPAGDGGRNYGWPLREGSLTNASAPSGVTPAYQPLVDPIHEYGRSDGTSVTGGHVYRGRLLAPRLLSRYVFGDLSNRLRSIRLTVADTGAASADDVVDHGAEVGGLSGGLVSIDADLHGELYLVMIGGTILRLTTTADGDGDGLDDAWQTLFGLDGLAPSARGPFGDPDSDGEINAVEYWRGSHPRGTTVGVYGEGAAGFFRSRFVLLNDTDAPRSVALRFQPAAGRHASVDLLVPARRTASVDSADLAALTRREFATTVDAAAPIASTRTVSWPSTGEPYGSHMESAIERPATTWYFAEGATTVFELFLLLGNPSATQARVRVDYLLQGAAPVSRVYDVPPRARRTIWVNQEPGLDGAQLGAVVTVENAVPIVAERAMYSRGGPVTFAAGHAAAGEPALATRWVFAEGSTSQYFETFVTVINPWDSPLPIDVRVRLQDGSTTGAPLVLSRVVPPLARATLWLDREVSDDGIPIGGQDGVSVEVQATQGFVAERAMWWPGTSATWHEAHAAAGFSEAAASVWRLPGVEYRANPAGGEPWSETYVLVANVGTSDRQVEVSLFTEDREPLVRSILVPANGRVSVPVSTIVEGTDVGVSETAFGGVVVRAIDPDAQLYAEIAVYGSTSTSRWARGAAARGTR